MMMPDFDHAWLPRAIWADFVQYAERRRLPKTARNFEVFLLYRLLQQYRLEISEADIYSGGVGDNFIDGVIVTINGKAIVTPADFYAQHGNDVEDYQIEFIQLTSRSHFSQEKCEKLAKGAISFLRCNNLHDPNAAIKNKLAIKAFLDDKLSEHTFTGAPDIVLTYVWPGRAEKEAIRFAANLEARLNTTFPDQRAEVRIFDKDDIQTWASDEQVTNRGSISRYGLLACPPVSGAEATFVGYVSASEVLKLVRRADDDPRINFSVFYDNVRAFLGWTDVNKQIALTLQDQLRRSEFLLRNNGITITAKSFESTEDRLYLENYQIVNGCQTCSVIAKSAEHLAEDCLLPVKVICSNDAEVIDKAIDGANRQNPVNEFAFLSRKPFARKLEQHFQALHASQERLYLARQDAQYGGAIALGSVNRDQVISLITLIRSVAVLIRQPHQVQRAEKREIDRWVMDRHLLDASQSLDAYHLIALLTCRCRSEIGFDEWERKYGAKFHLIYVLSKVLGHRANRSLHINSCDYDVAQMRAILRSCSEDLIRDSVSIVKAAHNAYGASRPLSAVAREVGFTRAVDNQIIKYFSGRI